MSFLITIFCLSFVIFIHELGHLLAAKWGGMAVPEFSVGMGPKLVGFKYKETTYNIRLFPVGGFVKLAGLDDSDQDFQPERHFQNRPIINRIITISAGSVMNVLLGFLIFVGIVLFVGVPETSSRISSVVDGSPAFSAGLTHGDTLIKVNGNTILDVYRDFIETVQQSQGPIEIVFQRGSSLETRVLDPYFDPEYQVNRIGIQLESINQRIIGFKTLQKAGELTLKSVSLLYLNIQYLLEGKATLNDLSGPVGIVQIARFQLAQSIVNFFNILAFISITLGIMNLLPIPVLDGGHLMFLFFEMITGKSVPKNVTVIISNIFALVLIFLMGIVVVNDFRFWGERDAVLQTLQDQ